MVQLHDDGPQRLSGDRGGGGASIVSCIASLRCCPIDREPGDLDPEQAIGELVLDGLELADLLAELDALAGVGDEHVEALAAAPTERAISKSRASDGIASVFPATT